MTAYAALVLAGGAGRRLGGAAKASLLVAGTTLLDRALDAASAAEHTIVVGGTVTVPVGIGVACEEPAGGGPVAAVEAGLIDLVEPLVAVLAVDQPMLTQDVVDALAAAVGGSDGAVLVDGTGRRQYLAAVYRTEALRTALERTASAVGASMRDLVRGLDLVDVASEGDETLDCDTWEDVERAQHLLEHR